MKKLLMLLVFSASFFASAQTVNVIELSSSTGAVKHVYKGDAGDRFDYTAGDLTFVSQSSFEVVSNTLIESSNNYKMTPPFLRYVNIYLDQVGSEGIFYGATNNRIAVSPANYMASTAMFLETLRADPAWSSFGDTTWMTVECEHRYSISYNPSTRRAWVTWSEIDDQGNFANPRALRPLHYDSIEEAHTAIQDHIIETAPCDRCTYTFDSHDDLNALIVATDPSFNTAGFSAWIDRVDNELRWNRISITGDVFTLEVGAGSEQVGTRTTYDCLEELLSNLPQ